VLLADITTRGSQAWSAIAAVTANQPSGGPVGTGPVANPPAGTPVPTVPVDVFSAALDAVQQISFAAELAAAITIQPVMHVSGNDVTLAAVDPNVAAGVGIAVIFSPRDASGAVLMTANRVFTADTRTVAGAVFYPATAAVTGNVFVQVGGVFAPPAPALDMLSEPGAHVEAMANVVVTTALIVPARTSPAPSPDWSFLNTVG
jgi:hypothetical protein